MQLNEAETATVLAALRYWQERTRNQHQNGWHFENVKPLTPEQIDTLCERINTDEPPLVIVCGGVVQHSVGATEVIDYDKLNDGDGDDHWAILSERAKVYVREHDPDIASRLEPTER